ncbi:hypothetical protein GW915_11245 [bacterium]|nr:hypothetical protein [bacterium]
MKKFNLSLTVLALSISSLISCEQADPILRATQTYRTEVDSYEAVLSANIANEDGALNSYESYSNIKSWRIASEKVAKMNDIDLANLTNEQKNRFFSYVKDVQIERNKREVNMQLLVPYYAKAVAETELSLIASAQAEISTRIQNILNQSEDHVLPEAKEEAPRDTFESVVFDLNLDEDAQSSPRMECMKIANSTLKNAAESCVHLARLECTDRVDLSCIVEQFSHVNSNHFYLNSLNRCGSDSSSERDNRDLIKEIVNLCEF